MLRINRITRQPPIPCSLYAIVFWRPYGGGGFDELPAPAPPQEAATAQPRRRPAPAEDLDAATRAAALAPPAAGRRKRPSTRASPGSFQPRPPTFVAEPAGARSEGRRSLRLRRRRTRRRCAALASRPREPRGGVGAGRAPASRRRPCRHLHRRAST